jgi:hypothetical protein
MARSESRIRGQTEIAVVKDSVICRATKRLRSFEITGRFDVGRYELTSGVEPLLLQNSGDERLPEPGSKMVSGR